MSLQRSEGLGFALLAALLLFSFDGLAAAPEKPPGTKTSSVLTNDLYAPFLINNVFNYYGNNGDGSYNKFGSDDEGFEFFKGDNKHLIFEDGVLWGGFHKGSLDPKVGGSVYRHALQAGPIITYGTPTTAPIAADPSNPSYRVYRVRPDITPHTPAADAEAKLDADEVPFTGRYETLSAQNLYDQYIQDWNEWPAALGAPFTDVDGNGVYDPAVDIPGVSGADQTLWYVANDMSASRVNNLAGCPPIGLEMQRTIWGYRRAGALGTTIFCSSLLINKSGAPVDSMFLMQWADPDVGDAGDDHVGCDTLRNLGYAYNGNAVDKVYGTAVPAPGFALLQGPAVPSPGDTAIFHQRYRPGYRNLPMTAFGALTSGFPSPDPRQGSGGNIDWYQLMLGRNPSTGSLFLNPFSHEYTKFVFPGDPVKATDGSAGWVDGVPGGGVAPSDRRLCLSTGPFTFAAGDTQEIVVATAAGVGADRLSSISVLRSVVDNVRAAFNGLLTSLPPAATTAVSFPNTTQASLRVVVDGRMAKLQKVTGSFRTDSVSGPPFDFYDDGTHGDSLAGDKLFTSVQTLATALKPISVDLSVVDGLGITRNWPGVQERISIAGPVHFTPVLFSDNINSDGQVNPGENIRYGITTTNQTRFTLASLEVKSGDLLSGVMHAVPSLTAGASDAMVYDVNNGNSYFTRNVPSPYPDSLLKLPVSLEDADGNRWDALVTFPVVPFAFSPKSALVNAVTGSGKGAFEINIVNPSALKNHQYAIEGVTAIDTGGTPGFTLRDVADGRVLLQNHPLPDELGHNTPATDGFKVLRGTIDAQFGYSDFAVGANGQRDITYTGADPAGSFLNYLEGFNNTIGTGFSYPFIATSIRPAQLHSVTLKSAAATGTWDPRQAQPDTNFSRGYRYVRGCNNPAARPSFSPWIIHTVPNYGFQDYNWSVPFSAWDVDATPPRRLAVGHLENNVTLGLVDGKYWPQKSSDPNADNASAYFPREWFFIYDLPYTDTPDPRVGTPNVSTMISGTLTVPLMWWGVVTRRAVSPNDSGYFRAGDEFTIIAKHPPSTGQTWTFNPELLLSVPKAEVPLSFALDQNYPNPFNPSTTIRYQLPSASHVTLRIYDLLGREVALLVNGIAGPGTHEVHWSPRTVASGVYFYRLEATPQDGRGGKLIQTKKMLFLQ